MNSSRIVVLGFLFIVFGCSKNNDLAKPEISLKTYTDAVYNDGRDFNATLTFQQKNYNISGDTLTIIRKRYNQSYVDLPRDTFGTRLPYFPNDPSGNFVVTLTWISLQYGINGENDTCDFKFVLVDQNNIHSDTVSTGKVIIYQ